MNILVTGHLGFIGSHIVKRYEELGHNVWTLDRNIFSNYYDGDLRLLVTGNGGIDVINHHAAQTDVRKSVENPEEDARENIFGMFKMIKLAKTYKVKNFIFASTGGAMYGDPLEKDLPVSEEYPENPLSPYGLSKLVAEKYLAMSGIPYITLRYSNVWSENATKGIYAVLRDNPEPEIWGKDSVRDYVHVDDVVEANILALENPIDDVINIGTGIGITLGQLVKKFNSPRPKFIKAKKGDVNKIVLDISKANNILNWKPKKQII